ncbi:MAG TPA: PilZ domain-containing protein, partial [Labilithrix sp.]|nr:PilZ domain-containing protein [Labilithrix sp.]
IADRTLDVSAAGLLLPLLRPVLTGESLIVSFSIPGTWVDAEATVVRVVHGRRPGDDGLAVGVLFDELSPAVRGSLSAFLRRFRAPLPRRGPLARLRRGQNAPRLADEAVTVPDRVDGLGVLRAVVGAWQTLTVPGER